MNYNHQIISTTFLSFNVKLKIHLSSKTTLPHPPKWKGVTHLASCRLLHFVCVNLYYFIMGLCKFVHCKGLLLLPLASFILTVLTSFVKYFINMQYLGIPSRWNDTENPCYNTFYYLQSSLFTFLYRMNTMYFFFTHPLFSILYFSFWYKFPIILRMCCCK